MIPLAPDPSTLVGYVDGVSPDAISVLLRVDAPHGTAIVESDIQRFPQVNGFVVVPSERGSILSIVTWLGMDDDSREMKSDPHLLGLPHPRRRLRATPLGVLRRVALTESGPQFRLDRGGLVFPTVGDPVRVPNGAEAAAAIPSVDSAAIGIVLGTAPLASDREVSVSANRMFGRHLAVLGNTGSGKSCSVAHLIRQAALTTEGINSGFRVIVLDLNGEYGSTFNDLTSEIAVRRFSVDPSQGESQLRVPAWMWNLEEWFAFTGASEKAQAPVLREALQLLREAGSFHAPQGMIRIVGGYLTAKRFALGVLTSQQDIGTGLSALDRALDACSDAIGGRGEAVDAMVRLQAALNVIISERRRPDASTWNYNPPAPTVQQSREMVPLFEEAICGLGGEGLLSSKAFVDGIAEFDPNLLLDLVPLMAISSGLDQGNWVLPMVERMRIAFSDERWQRVCGKEDGESIESWLTDYLGSPEKAQLTVVDLSLVPTSFLGVITSTLGRLVFEALERSRKEPGGASPPVILVVEESHSVMRRHDHSQSDHSSIALGQSRAVFERISREGRKFGLSLLLSSQRPSELSETILAQCNTFLVHRLVNGRDQEMMSRLLPDSLGGLLQELPLLPTQVAMLVGAATDIPILVRMSDLPVSRRPSSSGPDFEHAWKGNAVPAPWRAVARSWAVQGEPIFPSNAPGSSAVPMGRPTLESLPVPGLEDDPPF